MAKRKGRSAAFMRSINPHLKHRKINKRGHLNLSMAKRRRSTFSRIKKYARHHRGAAIGVLSIVLGTVGYLVFDALVKPYIPISGVVLSIAEIGLGFWLASRKTGWVKNIGLAAIFLNMFVLAKMYITPSLQSIIPGIAV